MIIDKLKPKYIVLILMAYWIVVWGLMIFYVIRS